MNNQNKRLRHLIRELGTAVNLMQQADIYGNRIEGDTLLRALKMASSATLKLREFAHNNLYFNLDNCDDSKLTEIDAQVAESMHITTEITTEKWLHIVFPVTLLSRNISEKFMLAPMIDCAIRHCPGIQTFKPYDRAVMILVNHCVAGTYYIDPANIELKPIIDTVASYSIPDDSYEYLDLHVINLPSKHSYTEIFTVPYNEFQDFYNGFITAAKPQLTTPL